MGKNKRKKKLNHPGPLSPRALAIWAREAVLEAAKTEGDGDYRQKIAVRMLAKRLDKAISWPVTPLGLLAEAVDGPAVKIILGAVVRHAYNKWQAELARAERDHSEE